MAISHEARLLCLAYAFWGYDQHALDLCGRALTGYWAVPSCLEQKQKGEAGGVLCSEHEYAQFAEIKALQALAYWRTRQFTESGHALYEALNTQTPTPWLAGLVHIAISTPPDQQIDASRTLSTQLDTTLEPRCRAAFAAIFPEHAKTLRAAMEAEKAADEAAARRRWTYIIAGAMAPLILLAGATAYQYRSRIAAFLTTAPSATAPQSAAPGYPAPYPSYWQAGYMNRAYQIAAYCWAAVWILVSLPIVLLLAIPAVSLLLDFSAAGFQTGIANARGFAGGFLDWGRLWFGLLLLCLAGFTVTKLYGRYSLPKPFRPRIRVIRTAIRLVFLTVMLISVGAFLSYFSGVALNLYNNPMVKILIDILRKTFGV